MLYITTRYLHLHVLLILTCIDDHDFSRLLVPNLYSISTPRQPPLVLRRKHWNITTQRQYCQEHPLVLLLCCWIQRAEPFSNPSRYGPVHACATHNSTINKIFTFNGAFIIGNTSLVTTLCIIQRHLWRLSLQSALWREAACALGWISELDDMTTTIAVITHTIQGLYAVAPWPSRLSDMNSSRLSTADLPSMDNPVPIRIAPIPMPAK